MKTKRSLLVVLATVLCMGQTATEYESPEVNHLAGMLNCNCGGCRLRMDCVMPPTGICPICRAAKIRIAKLKMEGRSDNQVLDAFVEANGTVVLAVSPGPYGSAAPYLVFAFGLVFVFWAIRRYRNFRPTPAVPLGTTPCYRIIVVRLKRIFPTWTKNSETFILLSAPDTSRGQALAADSM